MDERVKRGIGAALGRVPSGLFVLTAKSDERRSGMLASWVQQVCFDPPMVSVAVAKGRAVMPLISESRWFGLCQLPRDDKVILRKFAKGVDPDEDPFLGFEMRDTTTGVPILANVVSYLACEVACHIDAGGDHDLFIGVVRAGACNGGDPMVRLREDGFSY